MAYNPLTEMSFFFRRYEKIDVRRKNECNVKFKWCLLGKQKVYRPRFGNDIIIEKLTLRYAMDCYQKNTFTCNSMEVSVGLLIVLFGEGKSFVVSS